MYTVIKRFCDLQDKEKHIYAVGDEFPRSGLKPTEKRIAELASDANKVGVPLIEAVGAEETENADAGMPRTEELVRQRSAKVARKNHAS
jgi:hypothetical protein